MYIGSRQKYFSVCDAVPIRDVVPPKFQKVVLETDTKGDLRVLIPLIYNHITPYGKFHRDP